MSSKHAPPLTEEQQAFETHVRAIMKSGHSVGFGRDENGKYFAVYAQELWLTWQAGRDYRVVRPSEPSLVTCVHVDPIKCVEIGGVAYDVVKIIVVPETVTPSPTGPSGS